MCKGEAQKSQISEEARRFSGTGLVFALRGKFINQ